MDADCYVVEYMIRDRLNNARARARVAALLGEVDGSRGPDAVKARFTDLGRELVNGVRKVTGKISHALPGRARIAKHW